MILYMDIFSGISGDMMLGGLIDLGTPIDWLEKELSTLFDGFSLEARPVVRRHLRAMDLSISIDENKTVSRQYADIRKMISHSRFSEKVKLGSLAAFEKIAAAEAAIHNKDIDTVHFHEIGAVDSLIDIIGTFLALEYLDIDSVYASQIPLGSGFVTCSHGTIPVPAPATLAILKDIPVKGTAAETEIVTPTGAALAAVMAKDFGPIPPMKILKIGYGAGKRRTGLPCANLLRLVLGDKTGELHSEKSAYIYREDICEMKTDVDDMNPEIAGFVMQALFEKGALDVTFLPVQMKKNRPALELQVLCRPQDTDRLAAEILSQTTSTGVRCQSCIRYCLAREILDVDTAFGKMQVKKITDPEGRQTIVPEYESAAAAARKNGLPLKEVYQQIISDAAILDSK